MANTNSRTYNAKWNMLSSLLLQVVTAISGLILPRLIIPAFGSEVNGLIATITQFISYITLLEAGVGSVFRASLYKPLHDRNIAKISGIINEQKRFYRKIGIVFIAYLILLCAIFPIIVKTEIDKGYVVALILILSVGTFLEYFVSLPYQSLIVADQMIRLVNILGSAVIVANIISTVILIRLGADILIVKTASCIIAAVKPIVYVWYTKKNYKIDSSIAPDSSALKQRWNGMVHHFAYYIHRNTDIVILSIFVGTSTVSVYSIYLAIVAGIQRVVTSISTGLNAGIGNMLADGDEKVIDKTVDIFEFVQIATTTVLYTITAILLIPFIRLYTAGITDANYIQPVFGYILLLAEAVYCIRCVYSSISMNGNKFKETQNGAILEGAVNLFLSLCLMALFKTQSLKLVSIAIGTLVGMMVRLIYEVLYLKRDLIFRPVTKMLKTISINILLVGCAVGTCILLFDYNCISVWDWVIKATLTTCVVAIEAIIIYYVFSRKTFMAVVNRILKRHE